MGPESYGLPGQLAQAIDNYLVEHSVDALLGKSRVIFDMRSARCSVGESHGRCLLQFWSEERNLVRTLVEVQQRLTNFCAGGDSKR